MSYKLYVNETKITAKNGNGYVDFNQTEKNVGITELQVASVFPPASAGKS